MLSKMLNIPNTCTMSVNPAYAGSRGVLSFTGITFTVGWFRERPQHKHLMLVHLYQISRSRSFYCQ
jgi:hypothetical protein